MDFDNLTLASLFIFAVVTGAHACLYRSCITANGIHTDES
jgi:hypothetical protein